ncbi:MAG: hypothetical protein PHX68_02250 [Alphaproteobacteria bacterium]|nr:hypothetical protein [Alphaproteobacteria bacterium]
MVLPAICFYNQPGTRAIEIDNIGIVKNILPMKARPQAVTAQKMP